MPFEYSALIFAAIFSYIVFSDIVTIETLIGGAVILFSGCTIIKNAKYLINYRKIVICNTISRFK